MKSSAISTGAGRVLISDLCVLLFYKLVLHMLQHSHSQYSASVIFLVSFEFYDIVGFAFNN